MRLHVLQDRPQFVFDAKLEKRGDELRLFWTYPQGNRGRAGISGDGHNKDQILASEKSSHHRTNKNTQGRRLPTRREGGAGWSETLEHMKRSGRRGAYLSKKLHDFVGSGVRGNRDGDGGIR